jgi:hypothetical protein
MVEVLALGVLAVIAAAALGYAISWWWLRPVRGAGPRAAGTGSTIARKKV